MRRSSAPRRPRLRVWGGVWVWLIAILSASPAWAAPPGEERPLRVLYVPSPPLVRDGPDGRPSGAMVDLFEDVALALDLRVAYERVDPPTLLKALERGECDVGLSALSVTSDRERRFDFTHPVASSSLAVVSRLSRGSFWRTLFSALFAVEILELILVLGVLQFVIGAAMWRVERRANAEAFPNDGAEGLWAGMWWASVTMATVGYGDKVPRTRLGRALAMAWMLLSLVLVSAFTGVLASAITIERMQRSIDDVTDLGRVRIGTVRSSTAEQWLRGQELDYRSYPEALAALEALGAGEIDAVVYDRVILDDLLVDAGGATVLGSKLQVLTLRFQRQDYAFAVPSGSLLRERINAVLPDLRSTEAPSP